jgi:DNA-binding Xre family transcriptional regulator
MLTFNFSRIFTARGIEKPFTFLVKAGYSDNFATRIVHSRHDKLNLKEVERLCELFQCTPNDLLEWIPKSKDADNGNHPLISLKRSGSAVQLAKILSSIPLDKLGDIEVLIKKELEK